MVGERGRGGEGRVGRKIERRKIEGRMRGKDRGRGGEGKGREEWGYGKA